MAKVVTFGAFVEILPGVEGLVHISELAAHHVENPREVVSQGEAVNVRILEIDGERRRLSLSLKRVEEGDQPVPRADGAESVHTMPDLKLSEEAFPSGPSAAAIAVEVVEEIEMGEAAEARWPSGVPRPRLERGAEAELVAEAEAELVAEAEAEVATPRQSRAAESPSRGRRGGRG